MELHSSQATLGAIVRGIRLRTIDAVALTKTNLQAIAGEDIGQAEDIRQAEN